MFFLQNESGVTTATIGQKFPDLVKAIIGDFGSVLPETILSVGVCWVILADVFAKENNSRRIGFYALTTVIATVIALWAQGVPQKPTVHFADMIVLDGYGWFFKLLILVGTAICIPMMMIHPGLSNRRMGEFYGLLLGSVVGMFLMVSAKNLLMVYLGIEFASITCYLLTAYQKDDRFASEGGLKYVIYGSVASGLMVYGLSWMYGLTGSLDIAQISQRLIVEGHADKTALVAALFTFTGFAYKIAAFPMHFWCPDVYQGASLPFTAFLSVVSKAAGFAVFIRFVAAFAPEQAFALTQQDGATFAIAWPEILGIIAAITMTIGNFAALFQDNLKRLLAYSSIAHAGYLLMGLTSMAAKEQGATLNDAAWWSVAFYLVVYLFMNLGAFLIVAIVSAKSGDESVHALRGLSKRNFWLAAAMLTLLVSLIGIPPTAGFTGKWQLLQQVVDAGFWKLAVLAAVNTAVSAWYYLRLVKIMFLDDAGDAPRLTPTPALGAFVFLLVMPVFYLFFYTGPTIEAIRRLSFSIG